MRYAILLLLPLLLASCATRRETVRDTLTVHDTMAVTLTRVDSLTVRDTLRVTLAGDTVRIDRAVWRDRWQVATDTVVKVELRDRWRDREVEVTHTRTPLWAWLAMGAMAAALLLTIIKRIRR